MRTDGIDVVLRIDDLSDLPCARACLFALIGQMRSDRFRTSAFGPLQIHLMTQRLPVGEIGRVREACADLIELDERTLLTLHNWDYRQPFDLRAPLLNWALEIGWSRYFTAVQVSDQWQPGALAALLERLETTSAAAALGGLWTQRTRWWGDVLLPLGPASPAEATPAAAFLVDRTRLRTDDRFCFGDHAGEEVVEFLNGLRGRQAVDERLLPELLCVRQVFHDA